MLQTDSLSHWEGEGCEPAPLGFGDSALFHDVA